MFFQNRWVEGLATDMFCHARASERVATANFCPNQWVGCVGTDLSTHARGSEGVGTEPLPTNRGRWRLVTRCFGQIRVTKCLETVSFRLIRWVEGLGTAMLTHAHGSKGLGTHLFCHARGSKRLGTHLQPTRVVGRSCWNCQISHKPCDMMS